MLLNVSSISIIFLLYVQNLESQAKVLRDVANGKKEIAKELKDDACQTRLGGKWVCIRPLSSGY
jgi:hypothetical protein